MSEKGIIEWDIEKTNSDYLYEIKNETRRDEFAYLSYLYNYIWYGEFELDEATFEKAKTAPPTLKKIKKASSASAKIIPACVFLHPAIAHLNPPRHIQDHVHCLRRPTIAP